MNGNSSLKPEPGEVDTIPSIAGTTLATNEIRNKVYQDRCIYETPSFRRPGVGVDWPSTFADLRQAPITRVSKQIRNETLSAFYGDHDFVIQLPPLPSDWRSLRPRRKDYENPFERVWKKLNAFTPDQNNNLQANSLRFLSNLTLDIEIEPSRQFRLAGLGFAMSSRELCDEGMEDSELVETAGLDWNKCGQVKEAYLTAVDSCPLVCGANDLLSVPGVRCAQVNQAASALAALMCRIAKLCPHLTNFAEAFISPSQEFDHEIFEAQALQIELGGESSTDGDE